MFKGIQLVWPFVAYLILSILQRLGTAAAWRNAALHRQTCHQRPHSTTLTILSDVMFGAAELHSSWLLLVLDLSVSGVLILYYMYALRRQIS